MRLYLVRHAEAEEPTSDGCDPQRRLTANGRRQAARAAAFLGRLGLKPAAMWHSPLVRAAETAEILARAVHPRQGPVERAGLNPLDPVGPVADGLAKLDADLVIVGHEPFLGKLAGRLVSGSDSVRAVACGRAGPVCLERSATGAWMLRWAVPPEFLKQLPRPRRSPDRAGAKGKGVGHGASRAARKRRR